LRLNADFLQDAAAVKQAVSCCRNLRCAKFGKCGRVESVQVDDERLVAAGLSAMSGWEKLRSLRLEDPLEVVPGRPFWEALGGFSKLQDLRVQINSPEVEEPQRTEVLCLEGCRRLRHLVIDLRADNAPIVVHGFRSWKLKLHSTVRTAKSVCLLRNMHVAYAARVCRANLFSS
jgi:hypothetical protein